MIIENEINTATIHLKSKKCVQVSQVHQLSKLTLVKTWKKICFIVYFNSQAIATKISMKLNWLNEIIKQQADKKLVNYQLNKKNFSAQFLRWIVVTDQNLTISDQQKTIRLFQCLNFYLHLSSASTIKNHIMKQLSEVEKMLFQHLLEKTKISITLNCWSIVNWQSYMNIIVFFVNDNWKYQDVVMNFEFMHDNHTDVHLARVLKNVIRQHNLQNRVIALTTNNVFNNNILFFDLIRNLMITLENVNIFTNTKNDKHSIIHVSCLVHILQLTLQIFLNNVRVNSINDELQKN